MLKKLSKVLSLLLSLCILLTAAAVPALADGESTESTAQITGVGTIIAPPAGVLAAVPVGLEDASDTAANTPTVTVGNSAAGVYKNEQNLIIDGDSVSGGSFDLTAASGETSATETVSVSDILYYEDFEDVTVPETVTDQIEAQEYVYTSSSYLNKLDGEKSDTRMGTETATTVLRCSETGKQYASNTGLTIPLSSFTTDPAVWTVEATVRNPSYNCMSIVSRTSANSAITLQALNTGTTLYWRDYDHNNKSYTVNTAFAAGANANNDTAWVKIRLIIDFINGNVTYYENGRYKSAQTFTNMKGMNTSNMTLTWEIDDICVYSGTPYTAEGTVSGPSTITAPEIGKYTKHPAYTLLDSNGAEVEDAVLYLAKQNDCMKLYDNSLVVSGENVNTTANYVIAEDLSGDFMAKKEVKVSEVIYFEDFEDTSGGANVTTGQATYLSNLGGSLSDKSIALSTETNEIGSEPTGGTTNHYANHLNIDVSDFANGERYVTASFKYKRAASSSTDNYLATIKAKGDSVNIPIRIYSSNYTYIVCSSALGVSPATATNASSSTSTIQFSGALSTNEWKTVVLTFDLEAGAFTVKIGSSSAKTIYLTNFQNKTGFESLSILGGYVDDISIATGKDFYISEVGQRLNIPAKDTETIGLTAKYSDGTEADISAISESYEEIETSGASVTVSSSAAVQAYNLTLTDGFVASDITVQSDKDYVLLNGEEVSETTKLDAGEGSTVKAVYGASDLEDGRQVIIAHYGSDNNGNDTMKDVALGTETSSTIEAALTTDIASGDTIKVFTWIMDTLVPVKSVTIK